MKKPVFVDTAAWLALLNKSDALEILSIVVDENFGRILTFSPLCSLARLVY